MASGNFRTIVLGVCIVCITTVFFLGFKYRLITREKLVNNSVAASSSTLLTDEATWNAGVNTNTLLNSPSGSIKINDKINNTAISMSGTLSASREDGSKGNAVDGNDLTGWGWVTCDNNHDWWKLDLGVSKSLSKIRIHATGDAPQTFTVYASNDDVNYTQIYSRAGMLYGDVDNLDSGGTTGRYIKVDVYNAYVDACVPPNTYLTGVTISLDEITLYSPPTATHLSAATQIDGSEGGTKQFIAWETFTPTYTLESNTSVKFRFRTSPDHATWTSWSAYQTPASGNALDISGIADSASGANKYLQVESTLENTDAVHTPSVDSYSVQYHTNTKPNKPTAATAVVQ